MNLELRRLRYLDQEQAAAAIEHAFGTAFVYVNANGNVAIARPVLNAFRVLTADEAVWDRHERAWRFRERGDRVGRLAE